MAFTESINKSKTAGGFTLIELMITVAVIAILATITIPSTLTYRHRSEVTEALHLADALREEITYHYATTLLFPSNNNEAGVPEPNLLIGNRVTRIEVENGAIHITLGNKASKSLQGKTLSLRPAIVTGSPTSPISWLCGFDTAVKGMEAVGNNKTNLARAIVPPSCGD